MSESDRSATFSGLARHHGMHASPSSGPFPTDSNSRAYLGRDSDRDPNKRDYFYFYVWEQKSRDY